MKKILYSVLFLLTAGAAISQEILKPCGTQQGRSQWLKDYQANPSAYTRTNDVLYVPLTLHLVRNDKGVGNISPDDLLGSLCTLNEDFAEANIRFFFEGDLNYIDNSDYLFHETVIEGAYMMFDNNVDNTINNYIVSRAAGNCGYNLPYAGVCLAINCTEPDDHTWAHEIGHALSLPHPFLGWEGGVSHDGSVPHSFNDPAPEKVTYDYTNFQQQFYTDTLIIDTAWVEKVDGSNCSFAADGFCDTKPDYLASRWVCDQTTLQSTQGQKDPDGVVFRSDASLIMSYALDNCSHRFSNEQIGAMRANLTDQKPNLLYDQSEPILITEEVKLVSPLNGQVEDYRFINLVWEPVQNATHYAVKISTKESLSSILFETIVTEPNTLAYIDPAFNNRNIYWSVIPFNKYDFCHTFGEVGSFQASDVLATLDNARHPLTFYPNTTSSFQPLVTDYEKEIDKIDVYNMQGVLVHTFSGVRKSIELPSFLSAGLYYFDINANGERFTQRIVVVN